MMNLIINLILIISQYLKILLLKLKNKTLEYNLAFLSLILHKVLNIDLPEEPSRVFDLASNVFIIIIICLFSLFNLLSTLFILYYKDRLNLELKFKDYPLILKYIKYYENVSNINIIWQTLLLLIALLSLAGLTLYIMYKIIYA